MQNTNTTWAKSLYHIHVSIPRVNGSHMRGKHTIKTFENLSLTRYFVQLQDIGPNICSWHGRGNTLHVLSWSLSYHILTHIKTNKYFKWHCLRLYRLLWVSKWICNQARCTYLHHQLFLQRPANSFWVHNVHFFTPRYYRICK